MNKSRALWAVLFFLSLDIALFRLPVYCHFVRPNSFAGALVQRCRLAEEREKEHVPLIALVGDSRLREGFSAKTFDELAAHKSMPDRALNLAVSGSTLRVWYYLLKHVDPNCRAFKMIVVALPSYWDEDYNPDLNNLKLDLQTSLPILTAFDTPEFVASYDDDNTRGEVLLGAALKLYGYRRDVKNFMLNVPERLAELNDSEKYWTKRDYVYDGEKHSMAGIRIVNHYKLENVPPHLEPAKLDRLKQIIFQGPAHPDCGKWHYMHYWLNRLALRYANSPTKIALISVPNNPLPVQSLHPHLDKTVSTLAKYPNVVVLPTDTFASLNKPENFCDDVHLNAIGRRKFTQALSEKLLNSSLLATGATTNRKAL